MSILDILTTNKYEKELRQKSKEFDIEKINSPQTQKFFQNLEETMYQADGAGLAAPQVGELIRIVCVNMGDDARIFINPKILKKSWVKSIIEEGCLSVPGIYGKVKRPKKITVEYTNIKGEKQKEKHSELPARVLQHEIDHLDGILFVDKIIN